MSPALVDFNRDSFPDLLLGFFKGGITHWRNTSSMVSIAEPTAPRVNAHSLLVFPNPVSSGSLLKVLMPGLGTDLVELRCYNGEGKLVSQWNITAEPLVQDDYSKGYPIKIPEELTPGIYQLVGRSAEGKSASAKVWIKR
ncbi:MAG: hypothetical protein EBS08_04625 [Cytophagia bacterium]|nr:hypothetical protein [Cytophagia bacterium]